MTITKTQLAFLLAISLLLSAAGPAAAEKDEHYFAVFMQDVKIGHARTLREQSGQEVTNTAAFDLSLSRGETAIGVRVETVAVETLDGKPRRYSSAMSLGVLGGTKKSGIIQNGQIQITTEQMGQKSTQTLPYPKDALMPQGATLLQKRMGLKAGTTYKYVEFDPENASGTAHQIVIEDRTSVPLVGKIEKLVPVRDTVSYSGQTFVVTAFVDDECRAKKFEMPMLGTQLVVIECDEAFAKSANGPFDVLTVGSVESPAAIADASAVRRATYHLAPVKADEKLEIPTTDSQTVTAGSGGSLTVEVALVKPGKAARPYKGTDAAALAALKPSQYVQSTDAAIVAKAREVVGTQTDTYAAAKAIEKWVGGYIGSKDLSTGYASAAETLKTRTGDCTEHAVLTAALCRAAGIPCRLVNGVAYADEFAGQKQRFIGHAWNQVFIDGKWVDLDAALGANAARLQLSTGGDDPTSFIGILKNLGNFKITAITNIEMK